MFYDPHYILPKHLNTYINGIKRSRALAQLADSATITSESVSTDIANSSVVTAVGSLDFLCKKILRESVLSYLYGFLEPPGRIRLEIPLTVARLAVDAANNSTRDLGVGTDHIMAATALDKSLLRRNFQGIPAIKDLFKSLGFENPQKIIPHDIYTNFEKNIKRLTEDRHEIVHTTAINLEFYDFGGEGSVSRSIVTDEMAESLVLGGECLIQYVESRLT
ncbi:hypothetical protein ACN4EA_09185 [Corynebacterium macclintockiae]|uniref:hypothetical protein n=1 Tax=Corynebacterium macclintockiae TaxID=2913501 RepID=UPI003EBFB5DB